MKAKSLQLPLKRDSSKYYKDSGYPGSVRRAWERDPGNVYRPLDPKTGYAKLNPNAETVAALEAAERGEVVTVGSIEELFSELNTDEGDGHEV